MQRPEPTTADERMADHDISRAVELLFLTKAGVASQLLDVETHDGVVELAGITNNLLARARAEAIAKEVRGVRAVVNAIEVRSQYVPDAELRQAAQQMLRDHAVTADYPIRCEVAQGELTVLGTVSSGVERDLTLQLLQGIRGIRLVYDQLQVQPQPDHVPAHLLRRIRALLDWDLRLKSDLLSLRRDDHGGVQVSGTVSSLAERDHVIRLAYAAGAAHVGAEGLLVAEWARDRQLRRQRFAARTDGDIEQAVWTVLRLDPRVRPFAATGCVNVHQGRVTLFGTVGHLLARDAAGHDAANVIGVQEVENQLQVRAHYLAADPLTQQRVVAALARDAYVHDCNFTVTVHDGRVRLLGSVPTHGDHARATEVTAGIRGVVAVENQVTVEPRPESVPGPEPDAVLAERIRTHFFWLARLHDQEISLEVHDGRVTLSGTVDTRVDREYAEAEAFLCGAREVHNHLRLL